LGIADEWSLHYVGQLVLTMSSMPGQIHTVPEHRIILFIRAQLVDLCCIVEWSDPNWEFGTNCVWLHDQCQHRCSKQRQPS
ncbi:hypothetical protein PENTCL1PPCAC_24846, partial [Pristionchus entomophagus]